MNIILKWLAEMRAIFYALDRTIEKKGDFSICTNECTLDEV
jgi:hypothetical protein